MSIASPSAVIMNNVFANDANNASEFSSQSSQFDLSSLNELTLDMDTNTVGGAEFLDRLLSPINQAQNTVVEKVSSLPDNAMNPAQLVELQKSFVEYNTNLIVASKCAKFAGDFVKETTHTQ